ncbi:O-acyltransferase like protein-like [Amphiura filiformis]|uniref:O-acyltransferase like protein-like n=1 Tax=Amphiura filiformis TaxID=82378 RepID=UPI003B210D6E
MLQEIVLCFAFNRNISKLLDTTIGQSQSIGCLHGIRVISLTWVALGHTFMFNFLIGIENMPEALVNILPSFFFQAVGNAYSSVDTFFFMSGFLLCYLTFTRMAKSDGKISWLLFYFHRIWRITPLYAFVILFIIYHHPYFGDGPKWYQVLYVDSLCEKYWWRNLLYINNYFPFTDMCIGWSWYLSCDMQFFIISPLILLPLFRSQTAGILVSSVLFFASLVVTGSLIGKNHLATSVISADPFSPKNYLELVYLQPYSRIPAYLIGIIMGYIMYRQISEHHRIRLSSCYIFCGSVMISYASAGLLSIAVEYPCAGLEKLMLRKETLDAFGKVPAGVLVGNSEWLGDYHECTSLQGLHYCSINFGVNSSSLGLRVPLQLKYGVCVPNVCSEDEIIRNIDNLTQFIPTEYRFLDLVTPINADTPVNCQDFPQRSYDAGFICFTVFCLILAILMLSGAALDVFQKYKKRKMINDSKLRSSSYPSYGSTGETNNAADAPLGEDEPLMDRAKNVESSRSETGGSQPGMLQEVLLCFAFNRNISKLLDTTVGQSQSIGCLHGIRVISITWVALGHTFGFSVMSGIENPDLIVNTLPSFFFQAVGNAYSAVDTFFFMSGFLLCYLTFTRMTKSDGKISWLLFYFHRIWRITPLYAFIILFMIYHHPYFGDGPKWYQAIHFDSLCEKYWWRNLLYINTYFPQADMCIQWSWYLSCDMQFFIISPLILLPLSRSQNAGILVASVMFLSSLVVTGSLIGKNHLATNSVSLQNGFSATNYLELVYIQPYSRIPTYLIGMIMGYIMYRQISEHRRIRLSSIIVSVGWALAFAAGISVIYSTYTSYGNVTLQSEWSNAVNVLYGTFSRLGWSLALCWVVFACYYGYGGLLSIAIEYPCAGLEKLILGHESQSSEAKCDEEVSRRKEVTTVT